MDFNNISFDELTTKIDKNPFFTITTSQVIFHFKAEELKLDLNLISNVRIIKKRVFYVNILLAALGFIFCYFIAVYYLFYSSLILLPILISVIILASFSIKQFSYKLLINNGESGFKELSISKKNVIYAQYFILLYKKNRSENEDLLSVIL